MKVHFDIDDLSFTFIENTIKKGKNEDKESNWVLENDKKIYITQTSNEDFKILGFNLKSKAFDKLNKKAELTPDKFLTYFKNAWLQEKSEFNEDPISGIENTEEEETEGYSKKIDYDPEKIRLNKKQFTIRETLNMLKDGEIDLSPDFQRLFVWKEIKKQSSLIESLLLQIPIPVFYLAENKKRYYQVIDGVQRLTVINSFVNNNFKLKNLEYFSDSCEKKYFKDIDYVYQQRIIRTMLEFHVLDPETPGQVKYNIFRRLNQGGKPLKGQEIRNSISNKNTRTLIKELANSTEFVNATLGDINPIRMQDQELVLRFIAFYDDFDFEQGEFKTYKGDMEEFLNDKIDAMNDDSSRAEEYKSVFYNAMNNASHLFGRFAFRKISSENKTSKRKFLINKSLFTAWSLVLSRYSNVKIKKKPEESLIEPIVNALEKDKNYYVSVTQGTNQKDRLKKSIQKALEITKDVLKV